MEVEQEQKRCCLCGYTSKKDKNLDDHGRPDDCLTHVFGLNASLFKKLDSVLKQNEETAKDFAQQNRDFARNYNELRRLCEFIRAGEIVAANVMASQIYEREGWGEE